ncbi:1,6-anhydro-N-acetylmuramyl-L-alanine amidase AmpD [Phytohalomonas tamaricis]|uniref:1,6-anhydro-N-acetylmuramyl-L-alanine amidase AmpD n=1 Tax=Phytohalomonas tamaricis TaxID=2081032 RepID=UPI000D0B44D9|nr:1,6-anhydro-N-acetylmuramyl-L-alanine amidase AmpD [Phytohalomonas tamaricis]
MAIIEQHRLQQARQCDSPNQNERPEREISVLVLHSISLPPGRFGGDEIERLFTNRLDALAHPYFTTIAHLRVSAHLLIRRNGECVQFVPFDRRAWHAGRSLWQGRCELNDFSIGIELEGDHRPFREVQYRQLAHVTAALLHDYPKLSTERIVSHEHIAPLRKHDPGPSFDWQYFRQRLNSVLAEESVAGH